MVCDWIPIVLLDVMNPETSTRWGPQRSGNHLANIPAMLRCSYELPDGNDGNDGRRGHQVRIEGRNETGSFGASPRFE